MSIIPKCKCLTATHILSNGKLRGFPSCHFSSTDNSVPFSVDITQDGDRQIVVKFGSDTDTNILCDIHSSIEKLIMLFDGNFVPLGKLAFSDSDCVSDNLLEGEAQVRLSQRLPLFNSADFCLYHSFSGSIVLRVGNFCGVKVKISEKNIEKPLLFSYTWD